MLCVLLAASSGGCAVFLPPTLAPAPESLPLAADIEAGAPLTARWIGHSTVVLRLGGVEVVTDPFLRGHLVGMRRQRPAGLREGELPRPEVVLVSHLHYDHCDLASLRALARPEATLVLPKGGARRLPPLGFGRVVELEPLGELDSGKALRLREHREGDSLSLAELEPLVSLGEELDDSGLDHASRDRDLHRVRALGGSRRRAAAGEQALVDEVEATALALHQLQVVEDAGKSVVPPPTRVQDVSWSHSERQRPRVHNLQPVGMKVEEDVAALSVRAVHESVDQQLANHRLVERRQLGSEHPIGQLVALAEVRCCSQTASINSMGDSV